VREADPLQLAREGEQLLAVKVTSLQRTKWPSSTAIFKSFKILFVWQSSVLKSDLAMWIHFSTFLTIHSKISRLSTQIPGI
jgi:hypothetical protein